MRCQNEGTDQIDEIENDGREPRHFVGPDTTVPAPGCPGAERALGIADLLTGDHSGPQAAPMPRVPLRSVRRPARPVR